MWCEFRLTKKTSEMMHHSNQLDQSFLKIEDLGSSPALLHYSVEHKSSITGLLTLSGGTGSLFVSSSLDATCKVRKLYILMQISSLYISSILISYLTRGHYFKFCRFGRQSQEDLYKHKSIH